MYTNQLIHETSPYLLQHAHNPVNWFPWGDIALQKAKDENKPILVSIGYAACHWCHVMERESFEDEATAALMNTYFINIKIDREERPDLDHIYMDAVQAITGSGGWPLNVFLTPDGKPFYGGTYFPPVNAYNRTSWKEVLTSIHKSYTEKKHEIEAQAENLTQHLVSANTFGVTTTNSSEAFTENNLQLIADNILKQADTTWGGFGKAPKFPQTFSIQFLLRNYYFFKDENALQQALLSLDKMINGGIYDHVGGGFSRYSTDNKWLAPHFEKMLYDNALLINVLGEAYQITKNKLHADTITQTMTFIEREMLSNENGFYSALDADSEGVEGKFYTWSKGEIIDILKEDAVLFCKYYDITDEGNWEHTNIIWVQQPVEIFAADHALNIDEFKSILQQSREKLLFERSKRIRPLTDDKILLGWNALMVTACCKAYAALGTAHYKKLAIDNMQFLENKFSTVDGYWNHTYKNGKAKIAAFLDDYAYLIQAYIQLQEITADSSYLIKAKSVTQFVINHFSEEATGFFFFTHNQQQDVIVRKKEVYDGAVPSGNAIMAFNLQYLSVIFDLPEWNERSLKMLQSLQSAITRYPTSFGVWAAVVQNKVMGLNEIVITGEAVYKNLDNVLQLYIPNKIVQAGEKPIGNFPLLNNRFLPGQNAFYLCRNYTCEAPVLNFQDFLHLCNNNSLILHSII